MTHWTRSTWSDAGQIVEIIDPTKLAGEAAGKSLDAWCAKLVQDGDLARAVEFMAHAMSRYDCIGWAVQSSIAEELVLRTDPMIVKVLQWVDNPEDERRRAVGAEVDSARIESPARLLCQAVFFSGGSIAPLDMPPIQPPADLCSRFATAALLLGVQSGPAPMVSLRNIIEAGLQRVTAP